MEKIKETKYNDWFRNVFLKVSDFAKIKAYQKSKRKFLKEI